MSKAKILLVEDSKSQADHARNFLLKQGYEVIWVENGKSAIKIAKTQPLDVILLDLILPDINGNEVCRWLKLNQDTKGIPIIMLTVKSEVDDKVTSLEAGADDYLPKPYSELELNARIYACLRTKALQDELRQKNRQMEELLTKVQFLAITDQLTELYNRRHFESVLKKEFTKIKRYEVPLTFLMIDIDHFKRINDTYGHHVGDEVLREIGKIIKKSIREVDTLARWGGEEFVILLPHTTKELAMQPSRRMLESIASCEFPSIPQEQITVSIGLAGIPDSTIDTEEKLIQAADNALYKAKENGRNRIEIYHEMQGM